MVLSEAYHFLISKSYFERMLKNVTCAFFFWLFCTIMFQNNPVADSENFNLVVPLEENRFYDIFCFFG